MQSYVYERVKLKNGASMITRYSVDDYLWLTILKFLFFLFILWPIEIIYIWPIRFLFKGLLIVLEFIGRAIWWLIKAPWVWMFKRRWPKF